MADRAPVNRSNTWAERTAVAVWGSLSWVFGTALILGLMTAGAALARL